MRRVSVKLATVLVMLLLGLSRVSPASACACWGFGCLTAVCNAQCSVVDCLCGYAGCTCDNFCLNYSPMCVWGRAIGDCGGPNCPCDYHCQSWPCTPCSYMNPDPCGCGGPGCDCVPKCTEAVWRECYFEDACACGGVQCSCCPKEPCTGTSSCTCGLSGCQCGLRCAQTGVFTCDEISCQCYGINCHEFYHCDFGGVCSSGTGYGPCGGNWIQCDL